MKQVKRMLLILILSFLLFPLVIKALTKETDYISIDDEVDISLEEITIRDAHFENPSDLQYFDVEIDKDDNPSNEYELTIYYYDINYNLLGSSGKYNITSATDGVTFSEFFSNIDKNKIRYFKLNITSSPSSNQDLVNDTSGDYYISDYDINMIVNENNTFNITEKITAYFNVSKHGIYRKIPRRNTITRLNGTKSSNRAKISDIVINEKYKDYNQDGYKILQIGDANKTITGSHTYNIGYKYNIGKDPLKDKDELYFNLIGTEWDTHINSVTFTITMPKEFDATKLGFSSGKFGATDSSNIDYEVDGNIIKGKLLKSLAEGEALTVRLVLPEGYFVGASSNIDIYAIILIVIPLIFMIIGFVIWYKFGRDDKVIETVEFYPPNGYNPAEIAYLYKGDVTSKEIVSLLIYLADKGYLKIEENGERVTGLLSKEKDFKITKLKEYDGSNEWEKQFFNGLFKGKKYANLDKAKEIMNERNQNGSLIGFYQALQLSVEEGEIKTSVTGADLYDNFYSTIIDIRQGIIEKLKPQIFELNNSKIKILFMAMIITIFILILWPILLDGNLGFDLINALIVILAFPVVGLFMIISAINKEDNISGIVVGAIFIGLIIIPILIQYIGSMGSSFIIPSIVSVISIIVLIIFRALIPKRTKYGNEILGKIKGFKNFLETAEKGQLEALVNQNPEYFYNILPYTYALGVSDIWIKQFETITIQTPNWFVSSSRTFNINDFNKFIDSTMESAQSTMTSSSSSSGSSGGGSSGGGSGGGGGGSW